MADNTTTGSSASTGRDVAREIQGGQRKGWTRVDGDKAKDSGQGEIRAPGAPTQFGGVSTRGVFGAPDPASPQPPQHVERDRQRMVENTQPGPKKVLSRMPNTVHEAGHLIAVVDTTGDETLARRARGELLCVQCGRALRGNDGEESCWDCLAMDCD
ncbi:hypothetical protein LTR78_003140 [Recurvomyces mirabilis]|uniref:Uncharacterized protein n=1 Tax=Recurvomyces mirabilis TaxID=574656 RepID=A0AAE0WRX7_9PEZI|nr:hypothetical protein LTR78_003140 [Recurvomyces mirabilis]KAK5157039.1 hypothetical protein LTS14_004556 [Recurvomyces mirabilis]